MGLFLVTPLYALTLSDTSLIKCNLVCLNDSASLHHRNTLHTRSTDLWLLLLWWYDSCISLLFDWLKGHNSWGTCRWERWKWCVTDTNHLTHTQSNTKLAITLQHREPAYPTSHGRCDHFEFRPPREGALQHQKECRSIVLMSQLQWLEKNCTVFSFVKMNI